MSPTDIWAFIGPYFSFEGVLALLNALGLLVTSVFVQWGLMPNKLTVEPTVFVAENEYQIAWESKYPSSAWVIVDGEKYVDSVGGHLMIDQTVHKVSVPMDALDAAKKYEIYWQHQMRGPLVRKQSKVMSKGYNFRPADFSDGFQSYHVSDTHSLMKLAGEASGYWGDKLDLLILNGDIATDLEMPRMCVDVMRLAWTVAKGERPVLYARGNHESRGANVNDFHRCVGTPSADRWYFTTRLGSLWIAVYDAAEDKADADEEYGGRADFEQYRAKETEFFDNVIANAQTEFDALDVEYRLLVCHVPVGSSHKWYPEVMEAWLKQANQMKLDLALHGHLHKVEYFAPGVYKNYDEPANYPVIIGCKPVHSGEEGLFVGTAVEFQSTAVRSWFTNQKREIITTLPVTTR